MIKFILNTMVSIFTFLFIIFMFYVVMGLAALQSPSIQRIHLFPKEGQIKTPEEFVQMNSTLKNEYGLVIQYDNDEDLYWIHEYENGRPGKPIRSLKPGVQYCGTEVNNRKFVIDSRCETGYVSLIQFIIDDFRHDIGGNKDRKGTFGEITNFLSKFATIYRVEQFLKNYENDVINTNQTDNVKYYYMFSDEIGRVNITVVFVWFSFIISIGGTILLMKKFWIKVKDEDGQTVIDANDLKKSNILSGIKIPGWKKRKKRKR